jgi:hypothetical protein
MLHPLESQLKEITTRTHSKVNPAHTTTLQSCTNFDYLEDEIVNGNTVVKSKDDIQKIVSVKRVDFTEGD